MEEKMGKLNRAHAVMFPLPAQGHLKPMMQLAKILSARGFYITFVNTEFIQEKMLKSGQPVHSTADFRFETVPDDLPAEHGRTLHLVELCKSMTNNCPPHFNKLVDKLVASPDVPPLTCIIFDGGLSWAQGTATRLRIPGVSFWTPSACGFYIYFSVPLLMEKGYIPLKDESSMEEEITCLHGMPSFCVKDIPNFFYDTKNYMFGYVLTQAQLTLLADIVILNTFDELEGPVLQALRTKLPVYSIGPLLNESPNVSASIWAEEMSYLQWLDNQEPRSVIYVCFGSITVMSENELVEFAWGLEGSSQPFLWAIRPDLIYGSSAVLPVEFVEKVKGRGFFVNWAPQVEVLSHPSVGGFLTHTGWNSTLESIYAGVPMISWPFFGEQQINRNFVSQVWKIGFAMKDVVVRAEVQEMVKRLMKGEEGEEMRRRIRELKEASMKAVQEEGSSWTNLEKVLLEIQGRNKT